MNFGQISDLSKRIVSRADKMSTRKLALALLATTIIVGVPLLSVWQVAVAAGEKVHAVENPRGGPRSRKSQVFGHPAGNATFFGASYT